MVGEILGQADPVGAKSPIFSRYSLVAPQRYYSSELPVYSCYEAASYIISDVSDDKF